MAYSITLASIRLSIPLREAAAIGAVALRLICCGGVLWLDVGADARVAKAGSSSNAFKELLQGHVQSNRNFLQNSNANLFLSSFQFGKVILPNSCVVSQHLLSPFACRSQFTDTLSYALADVFGHHSSVSP